MPFPGNGMSTRTSVLALTAALVVVTGHAVAQWRVVPEVPDGTASPVNIAVVDNESGHSLRIYRDDEFNVRGTFKIRGGFDTIHQNGCPTYRVDERPPVRVSFADGRCLLEPKRAHFTVGKIGESSNRELRRFMNGSDIVFRYRLANGGYRETTFTLRGSKYALNTAIGQDEIEFDE